MSVTLTQSYVGNSNLVVGNKISITLKLEIKGADTLYNIVIKSPLNHQLSYVADTLKIDGAIAPAGMNNTAILVSEKLVGAKTFIVTFDAIIVDDTPNTITFLSTVEFIPLNTMKLETVLSNESTINIMYSKLYVVGDVEYEGYNESTPAAQVLILETEPTLELRMTETNYKVLGEYYVEFIISNISQLTLMDLLLTVNMPNNVEIVDSSLYINEIKSSLVDIPNPIPIGSMLSGEQSVVKFSVTPINGDSRTGKIGGELEYKYYVNGVDYTGTQTSEEETVYIFDYDLTVTQSLKENYLEILDTAEFTMEVENTGNDIVSDIVIKDIAPDRITVDPTTIKVDGVTPLNPNFYNGILVGTLPKGKNSIITFSALVDGGAVYPITVPNIAFATYRVYTDDRKHSMGGREDANPKPLVFTIYSMLTKGSSYRIPNNTGKVRVLETVPYGVYIKNYGNVIIEDLVVKATLSNNLEYIPESVYVNNVKISDSIINGVTVPKLNLQETVTITYSSKVKGYLDTSETPGIPQITNKVSTKYHGEVFGDIVTETVEYDTIVSVVETVNVVISEFSGVPEIIGSDEILTYTVELENTGIKDATNVKFKTNDNVMYTFVEDSVVQVTTGGDVKVAFGDPKDGWTIPLIKAGESVKYKYQVEIV